MNTSSITVAATLQADGVTLQLDTRVALPPGRVTVTMQPAAAGTGPGVLEVLDRIHREQQQRGRRQVTEEETAAAIAALRGEDDDYEEGWRQIWSRTKTPPGTPEKP